MDFKEFSEGSQNVKATVKTDNYSWGKMKTVHHGSSFSIPLHPEHHEAIAKLKDQQEHKFKDETGRHWTAKRDGNDVHFQGANGGNKTKVAHSTMKEEVEQIQEREDDEYHTPTKHHVQVTISKGNGPKEYRKATITAKEPDHAVNAALKHYKGQGYTVHDHKYLGENAPVAPTLDRKYIKGTPEHKAYKATKKPINGHPTGQAKTDDKLRAYYASRKTNEQVEEETMPQQSFKGFLTSLTELTDKQKQLDKNKNGQLDGQDFKMLRKEDSKCCEACGMEEAKCECMTEESHQSKTTMKHIPNASPALKKAAKDIKPGIKGYADRVAMLKAGGVKEEVELQEANHREFAQQGKMHPDMAKHMKAGQEMDFYHSKTGDKISGVVKKNDGKEVHVKAHKGDVHKFTVSSKLDESTKAEDPPFDGPYKKVTGDGSVKDKSGAVHTPMSRARDLARKAMQKKMKEDFNLEITEEQAAELCDLAVIDEKMDMSKADMGDVIKDFQKSDAPQFAGKSKEKRREMAIAAKMQSEETKGEDTVKSYKDFVTEIKMADLPSRTVKGTSYGAQYHDPEGEDDADDKKPKKASDAPKRGRGRPAGSKSGAKQQGSEKSSNYGGIDRTTYALHLPRK
jgi:hypothetical protein